MGIISDGGTHRAVQWLGVRLVIEKSLVRLPAGGAIKSTRSTQTSIPPGLSGARSLVSGGR